MNTFESDVRIRIRSSSHVAPRGVPCYFCSQLFSGHIQSQCREALRGRDCTRAPVPHGTRVRGCATRMGDRGSHDTNTWRQRDTETDRETDRHNITKREREREKERETYTDTNTHRQTGRRTDTETPRHRDTGHSHKYKNSRHVIDVERGVGRA